MALPLEETNGTLFLNRYIPEQRAYIKIFTVLEFVINVFSVKNK